MEAWNLDRKYYELEYDEIARITSVPTFEWSQMCNRYQIDGLCVRVYVECYCFSPSKKCVLVVGVVCSNPT